MFDPGALIGPYEVVSSLGAGAMGEVYRARDPWLGREVAIKIVLPGSLPTLIAFAASSRKPAPPPR